MLASITSCSKTPPKSLSLPQLEQRLADIDAELAQLAHYSLRSGIGAIGYRSRPHESPDSTEWVEIEFDRAYLIDEIVLVPTIWRDTEKGFQADGFPVACKIRAGTAADRTGTVVAEYGEHDSLLPRIAPLVVPISGTSASWIRVEATRLSPRAFDGWYVFQLSELLVFSGQENVALRQTVKTSSNSPDSAGAWDRRFLVDGFMPYLMDAAQGSQSRAYVSTIGEKPVLTLDLGSSQSISRIHLHAVDQDDTVPQAYAGDLGIPRHLLIEGADRADFSDAAILLDYRQEGINDTGPIMMWRIPEHRCRFVRLAEVEPDQSPDARPGKFRIGFAEIELFSKGRNVALGKPASSTGITKSSGRSLEALTDGNNLYGKILPLRGWISELARRHDLESERPLRAQELSLRYARQKTNLNRMSWLAALFAAGIGFTFMIERLLRMRQVARIKERFAADLHDEIGANIHTISMLSDLAQDAESPDESKSIHQRILKLTARTDTAIRHCSNMLEADGLYFGLIEDMKRLAQRIHGNFKHEVTFEGEQWIKQLPPRTRVDLFLFYKECLVNISRHSNATQVTTRLTATSQKCVLIIQDNGKGMTTNIIPASLKRRARMLDAKMNMESPPEGGICVILSLKLRKGFRLRPRNEEHDENSH